MGSSAVVETRSRTLALVAGLVLVLAALVDPGLERCAFAAAGAGLTGWALGLGLLPALVAGLGWAGSGALVLGAGRAGEGTPIPLAVLGALLLLAALVLSWRRAQEAPAVGPRWAGALGVLLALGGTASFALRQGLPGELCLALVPDLLHTPRQGAFRGAGEFGSWARASLAVPVLLFALASLFSATGALRARAPLQLATLLACAAGVRWSWCAAPGALGLALCAGDGLQRSSRAARALAAAAFALLVLLAFATLERDPPAARVELDTPDEWVRWRPLAPGRDPLHYEVQTRAGWVESVELVCVRRDAEGAALSERRWPLQRDAAEPRSRFTHAPIPLAALGRGAWSVELEVALAAPHGTGTGRRVIDAVALPRAPQLSGALLGFALAALCALALAQVSARSAALLACALVLLQAVWLGWSANPPAG